MPPRSFVDSARLFEVFSITSLFFTGIANAITLMGIHRGIMLEANPYMAFLNNNPYMAGLMTLVQLMVLTAFWYGYHKWENPNWRFVLLLMVVGSTAYNFTDALNNIIVLIKI